MPTAPSPDQRASLTRRTALASVAVGVLSAGCTSEGDGQAQRRKQLHAGPEPASDPDVALAATVLAREQAMLDWVTATARRHRSLRPLLQDTATVHRRHVQVLNDAVPDQSSPRGTGPGSPSASGSRTAGDSASASALPVGPSASDQPVPEDAGRALRSLARQEEHLKTEGLASSLAARSGDFARLLASMAAASAQLSVALTTYTPRRRR